MRPNTSGLPSNFTCLYVLIKQGTLKANFQGIVLLSKASLAEVQLVIDSCRSVSQSSYLNSSNKECDWLILYVLIREQYTADSTFTLLENKVWFQNSANAWEIIGFFIIKQIKKPGKCSVLF